MAYEIEFWAPVDPRDQSGSWRPQPAETWAEMVDLVCEFLAGLVESHPAPAIRERAEWLIGWCALWQPEATMRLMALTLPEHGPTHVLVVSKVA